ncbi:MAG: hypothetical protein FIA97_12910 [Methylococcaceae bacterium]|nr:hypothetical protein [Methylococcaceae bacterium]
MTTANDLLQAGLTMKAASFVTIGEPDIGLIPAVSAESANARHPGRECRGPEAMDGSDASRPCNLDSGNPCRNDEQSIVVVEIRGLDIYDPIKDEVKACSVADIAYWMVDDDYDGSSFMVRQVFFCGGDRDEFDKWKRGLSDLAKASTKRRAERTLKIEIDDAAFDRIYGHRSHPISYAKGKKIAVRVISQFGEECTKVLTC